MRNTMETATNKMKQYCDESIETARQITAVSEKSFTGASLEGGQGGQLTTLEFWT